MHGFSFIRFDLLFFEANIFFSFTYNYYTRIYSIVNSGLVIENTARFFRRYVIDNNYNYIRSTNRFFFLRSKISKKRFHEASGVKVK